MTPDECAFAKDCAQQMAQPQEWGILPVAANYDFTLLRAAGWERSPVSQMWR
ncbi:hypothetical protein P7K49_012605 [Saguinus oedipus]|uniref:Uncharacterized protein n=1 Tax=Saguinus oedipus TaxID=9490 RepID=A0ABQ9VE56_SAGOE|nr:hypothetical protein P7K49_012605 [Saguinus oedipus]